jgi:gliding motility-associated-like protein
MGHLWQDNSTNQTYSVTALGQGTYYCRVTDTTNCSTIDTVHINVVPNKNATITQIPPICSYSNPVTLNAAETGGVWSGTGITSPSAGTFNPGTAGQGIHLVRYVLSGMCGDKDSIYIKVNAPPVVNIGPDTSICQGTTYILDAGNPTLGHFWQNSSTAQTFSVITSGTYYCRVTDTTSCFAVDTAHIIVLPLKNATITQIAPVCSYQNPFNMVAAQSGGLWSGNGITNISTGLFNPATAGAGLHLIKYVLSGQCGDRDSIYVKVNLPPIVNLGNDTSICIGTSVVLNAGNPGMSYLWQNMSSAQTFTTSNGGTYYCKVTDTTGCYATDTIHITGITPKDATITPVGPVCMNIASFNLQAVDNGGIWTGTGISSSSTGLFNPATAGEGTHLVRYIISGQCGDRDSTEITVLAVPVIVGTATGETCMGKNDASVTLNVTGGLPPYQIIWNSGQTSLVISNLIPGIYTATVKDGNNCTVILSENLSASTELCYKPLVYLPNVFSPNSDGNNDIFYVRGEGIKTLTFVIYDRWGEKVFESTDPNNGWDGSFKGKAMPAEIYYYKVIVEFVDGSQKTVAGDITLTR